MFNIEKQIAYWIEGANSDLETAELLINNGKAVQGLFFCHLSIEKAIKALIVKEKHEIPPKSHNLHYLLEKSTISIDEKQLEFLSVLMIYQLEGRYPDSYPQSPSRMLALNYYEQTKELYICLKAKL